MRFYAPASPVFIYPMRNILDISNSDPVIITTTYGGLIPESHNYIDGLVVRILVPWGWGIEQINKLTGTVTVLDANRFTLPINSLSFDPFNIPLYSAPGLLGTPPQVVPIGNVTSWSLLYAQQNVLT